MQSTQRKDTIALTLVPIAALLWAGMVVGVSGLATPVKFTAPTLTLPVALDVGRVTFQLFSKIEWGLAAVLVVAAFAHPGRRLVWLPAGVAAAVVVFQALWLLPALEARIAAVIASTPAPPSALHTWYVVAEVVKLIALLVLGIGTVAAPGRRRLGAGCPSPSADWPR